MTLGITDWAWDSCWVMGSLLGPERSSSMSVLCSKPLDTLALCVSLICGMGCPRKNESVEDEGTGESDGIVRVLLKEEGAFLW